MCDKGEFIWMTNTLSEFVVNNYCAYLRMVKIPNAYDSIKMQYAKMQQNIISFVRAKIYMQTHAAVNIYRFYS